MADYSSVTFPKYLVNFENNYLYFALTYTGQHLDLYLDQFVHDQINMTQAVYGDHCAEIVRETAQRLSPTFTKAVIQAN